MSLHTLYLWHGLIDDEHQIRKRHCLTCNHYSYKRYEAGYWILALYKRTIIIISLLTVLCYGNYNSEGFYKLY